MNLNSFWGKKILLTSHNSAEYSEIINALKHKVEIDKEAEFNESIEYLSRSIKRDVLTKLYGEKAVYRQIVLKTDSYIKKAVEMLTSTGEYSSILEPGS
jgi:inosine/xanthosine triphosphate pyrophosphatase family protein